MKRVLMAVLLIIAAAASASAQTQPVRVDATTAAGVVSSTQTFTIIGGD